MMRSPDRGVRDTNGERGRLNKTRARREIEEEEDCATGGWESVTKSSHLGRFVARGWRSSNFKSRRTWASVRVAGRQILENIPRPGAFNERRPSLRTRVFQIVKANLPAVFSGVSRVGPSVALSVQRLTYYPSASRAG